jgi:hypothetical protein
MKILNTTLIAAILFCAAGATQHATAGMNAEQSQGGADGNAPLSPADMDALLAPIALYPDALIIQIVQCADSPYQVRQVNEWLKAHPELKGSAVQEAAEKEGFDASFIALSLFPQVMQMMADQPEWTTRLGQAFATDKDAVFASIQRLRSQAQAVGNLKTNEQQQVETIKTDNGQTVIVIEPANPQIVYVPVYNPQIVYVQPVAYAEPTTTYTNTSSDVAAAAVIGFAAGVVVGALADNDHCHYYYGYGGWGYHGGVCYSGGYNNYYKHQQKMAKDYYKHRENMANDWYDHRENMAGQRGENQGNRQENRANTRENAAGNQANRQDNRATTRDNAAGNQANRQDNRATTRDTASQNRSANQTSRQQTAQNRGGAVTQNRSSAGSRTGTRSDAFSGYQNGSTERASSARGNSSMSRSSANRSSGSRSAGSRSGGGRSGGGGGRGGGGRR